MKKYDYTDIGRSRNEVGIKLDGLTNSQFSLLYKMVDETMVSSQKRLRQKRVGWFYCAVLPALKILAQDAAAVLVIETEGPEVVHVTIKGKYGFNITGSCYIRAVIHMATAILVDQADDKTILTLTYDCRRF